MLAGQTKRIEPSLGMQCRLFSILFLMDSSLPMSTSLHSSFGPELPWLGLGQLPRIALVGDVILDEYLEGDVHRISPEAPVPVHRVRRVQRSAGGCANVARNLKLAGGEPILFGVCGQDATASELKDILAQDGIGTEGLLTCHDRPTIRKTRVTAQHQQMLRIDWEEVHAIKLEQQQQLLDELVAQSFDVLLVSDYGKGTLPEQMLSRLISLAREKGLPCIVDPKGKDFSRYRGATLVTPNYKEACEALGLDSSSPEWTGEQLGLRLQERFGLEDVLVTMGARGMCYVPKDGPAVHRAAEKREVFDVSGAGDTVIALMALGLASRCQHAECVFWANLAAGIVVQKWGTRPVYVQELKEACRLQRSSTRDEGETREQVAVKKRYNSLEELAAIASKLREEGRRLVFTNGCFDLVHAGHVRYLQAARKLGDVLIVGVNDDASIQRLKGPKRPIVSLDQRLEVLEGLACVDFVISFSNDTPLTLIQTLLPDVLVKGADWNKSNIVGADVVESRGGRVETVTLVPGISTSEIVRRIETLSQ